MILVSFMQSLSTLWIELIFLFFCFTVILLSYHFLGTAGLQLFIVIAVIVANIQVRKLVEFPGFPEPIAIGTVLFSCTYLCTDILSEYESRRVAQRAVFLGFFGLLFWMCLMFFTMGYNPSETDGQVQGAMETLFVPFPRFFLASMIAYLLSQSHDVFLFSWLKRRFQRRQLWFRNNLSTILSSLLDNAVFSLLAWIVFAPDPLPFREVFFQYILGTYALRIAIAFLDTPFIYLAGILSPSRIPRLRRFRR